MFIQQMTNSLSVGENMLVQTLDCSSTNHVSVVLKYACYNPRASLFIAISQTSQL